MIGKIKGLVKNELFLGSFMLLILINLGNIINYIFHFSMARALGPIDYGVLAALTNIIYIFSVPALSIQILVSRVTTKLNVKKEYGKIKGIFKSLIKEMSLISLVVFLFFSFFSVFLSSQLNISIWLLIITGSFIFISFISPISIGILQGMKKFNVWGINYIITCSLKLIIATVLVLLGFRVYGALIGFILGTFIAVLLTIPFIKEIISSKEEKEKIEVFSKNNLSIFLAILIVVLMYSLDIILVKKFFSPEIAGKYAIVSLLGKIILFGTNAVSSAMFPISSEKFEAGDKSRGLLKKSFLAIFIICASALFLFNFFPELTITLLFGQQYLSISNILIYIGIAFTFISFLNIVVLYKISKNQLRIRHTLFLIFSLILQISFLFFRHRSIEEFSIVFMSSTIIIFIGVVLLMKITKNESFNNNSSP